MKENPMLYKKNFHFVYICKKELDPLIDSSDEEAVAADKARKEMEAKALEDAEKGVDDMEG